MTEMQRERDRPTTLESAIAPVPMIAANPPVIASESRE
jgi:hypothetical protein